MVAATAPVSGATAAPLKWSVDADKSSIGFSGTQTGNEFRGRFGRWTATILFDPADLAHSSISVVIDTASAGTGDKVQETSLAGEEWFDSKRQPRATLTSKSIRSLGGGKYEADCTLTIKGKSRPVRLPFTLAITGKAAAATGQVTLDRTQFNLGMRSDPEGIFVSRQIKVIVNVKASH
jgi:cytochrome b561